MVDDLRNELRPEQEEEIDVCDHLPKYNIILLLAA